MDRRTALETWRTTRRGLLDNLVEARESVRKKHPPPDTVVDTIDHSLFPALAAEFQGYSRDLHSEVVTAIVDDADWRSGQLKKVTSATMLATRGLDRKNPTPNVIDSDFRPLGISVWNRIQAMYPDDYKNWREALETLIRVRNAISHSEQDRINEFVETGTLNFSYWSWTRKMLSELAVAMNTAVRTYLSENIVPRPVARDGADHA